MKLTLPPLESKVAEVLSTQRGVSPEELVAGLLREEAALELTRWRQHSETLVDKAVLRQDRCPGEIHGDSR